MSDEAQEFSAKLSHLEKSTLRGMASRDPCESGRANLLAELGLASGPDENGIYVLSPFGEDVLACCAVESPPPAASNAADEPVTAPLPSGG